MRIHISALQEESSKLRKGRLLNVMSDQMCPSVDSAEEEMPERRIFFMSMTGHLVFTCTDLEEYVASTAALMASLQAEQQRLRHRNWE